MANNMQQLEREILNSMRNAMAVAQKKILKDMQEETEDYYTGSTPVMYERTGALGETPRVSKMITIGKEVNFDAYLDISHTYTTGKMPPMLDVLYLADRGNNKSSVGYLRDTVGKKGFWERAEDKFQASLDEAMRKTFK